MPKNNAKKKITIDGLARIIAKGFENTATKQDLQELRKEIAGQFATKQEMRGGFKLITERIDMVQSDIRDLKISIEVDIRDLKHRVERLEQRVGIGV